MKNRRSAQLTRKQQIFVKASSVLILCGVMVSGFYVSFGTLVEFTSLFGKGAEAAIIVALIIDTLAVLGLGVTLIYPSLSSRVAFLGGIGTSSAMNFYIGLKVAGPVGAIVAVIPQLATILGERVVFDLLLPTKPHEVKEMDKGEPVTVIEREEPKELVQPSLFPDVPVSEMETINSGDEEVSERTPTPSVLGQMSIDETHPLQEIIDEVRKMDPRPGRKRIANEFGLTDRKAREVLKMI